MAVDMGGRLSLSAGPSLLLVSKMKKRVYSTVNDRSLAQTAAARRADVLQLQENIVEQMISKGTAEKKITRDLRRAISAASSRAARLCSSSSAGACAAIVGRTTE